ncbi:MULTISPECIES: lysine--tRNA ligase [Bosea]|uniref:lysine--tRNA ligase n=1 Tax=Bosea TaxID=85413 RepID=UPI0021500EAE|nr:MULTISPECIES: lysine--tRNA ligase [Bosea]MCR4522889.1 lysine--tRNA ligase [Bosea sp. 47.2.35]MDR6828193.1 lysyl-tRNA synthetase class 1 [Bosea robiniae]MDR6897835.1 lysyl-tRNA synthetase class 1 [Bosea sp. BE109]MDR7141192.1 lysyl-tRNA synthetase class 1 [Bosea sp. BE168]MDR7177854.1 lysyl-tRNA synthetase class 1 [Bosea sp. BE271]
MPAFDAALVDAAQRSAAWPFEEARKLVARIEKSGKKSVIFETGYGPSGLPHIGTFGEVARTSMVRHAFQVLTGNTIPTRLVAFSDDMDGLRKVPDNVPNKELLAANLGKPLTEVPDPFGTHDSFGRHNNARLCAFLDSFGFDYEFKSSTDSYRAGEFDATLLKMLARYDAMMKIMLPTLREERAATYSPFLPIHPKTRIVMQVPIDEVDVEAGTIAWTDPDTKERFVSPVTGGHVKLQWKPDWAMRWVALGVDYEMAGKDLIDSVKVSSQIARALDGTPPDGFNYELFLDEQGQKISKSKGNGLTIEDWLTYGPPESLALYMFQRPREAKKLHFDVIPRAVDEYLQFLGGYEKQDWKNRLGNPVWHIHAGNPPAPEVIASGEGDNTVRTQVTFGLLMNLVAVANSEDKAVLWGFLQRYAPGMSPETHPRLDALVGYAIAYFRDFVKPAKNYRAADEVERNAFTKLDAALAALPADPTPEMVQDTALDVARAIPRYQNLTAKNATPERPGVSGDWWKAIYQVMFGEDQGPRFGSFAAIYGLPNTRALIAKALAGDLVKEHAAFLAARKAD